MAAPVYSREEFERDSKGQTGDDLAKRTHYIPYFTKDGPKGTLEAACTAYVDLSCHSAEPSCWGCRAWLDNDADALKKLRDAEQGAH